jgi:putative hemolysin
VIAAIGADVPGTGTVLGIVAAGLFASAFFSGSETGYMSVSRIRLRRLTEQADRRICLLKEHLRDIEDPIMTCLIGTNLSNVLVSAVVTAVLTARYGTTGEGLALLVSSLSLIVLGEILPKVIYREYPERMMIASVTALEIFRRLVTPVRWLLRGYANLWRALWPASPDGDRARFSRRNLAALLLSNAIPETEDARFREAMERFLSLGKVDLRRIARPLSELVTVPLAATRAECVAVAVASGHSRLPVVSDDDRHPHGYLLVRDLLFWPNAAADDTAGDTPGIPWQLLRSFLAVDADMSPYELFEELGAQGSQLALVVDQCGEALGMVTREDLVEEVVGSIQDEFDRTTVVGDAGMVVAGAGELRRGAEHREGL